MTDDRITITLVRGETRHELVKKAKDHAEAAAIAQDALAMLNKKEPWKVEMTWPRGIYSEVKP